MKRVLTITQDQAQEITGLNAQLQVATAARDAAVNAVLLGHLSRVEVIKVQATPGGIVLNGLTITVNDGEADGSPKAE